MAQTKENQKRAAMPSLPEDFPLNSIVQAVAVTPTSVPTVYNGDLKRDWCIGLVPHGGYIMSLLAYTVKDYINTYHPSSAQPDLISSHIEFLARTAVGPCTLNITVLKLGRQFSNFRISLSQPDAKGIEKVCAEAYVMQGNLASEASNGLVSLETKPPLEVVPKRAEYKVSEELRKAWGKQLHRPAAYKLEYWHPRDANIDGVSALGPSIKEQWVRWTPSAGTKITVQDLPFLADAYKPLPESYGPSLAGNWYPTVNYDMNVMRAGEWEWLYVRVEMNEARNGRFALDIVIADEKGVVATSRHVALIVSAARNIKGRSDKPKVKI